MCRTGSPEFVVHVALHPECVMDRSECHTTLSVPDADATMYGRSGVPLSSASFVATERQDAFKQL